MSKFKEGDRVFLSSKCVDWEVPHEAIGKTGVVSDIAHRGIGSADESIYNVTLDKSVRSSKNWFVHDGGLRLVGQFEKEQTPEPQPEQQTPQYPQYQMHLVDMLGGTLYSEEYAELPTEADAVDKINREVSDDVEKVMVVIYKPHKAYVVKRTVVIEPVEGIN